MPNNYYQLYTLKTDDKLLDFNDAIVYEDFLIRLTFDFWSDGGDLDFQFYNKTDENLIVNLDSTFFIKNYYAYPYFINKYTQHSFLEGYTNNNEKISKMKKVISIENIENFTSQSTSVTKIEERQIIIPPKSYRFVRCDLPISVEYILNKGQRKYPDDYDEITKVTFTKFDTPILFRIRLSYQNSTKSICNSEDFEFYISEITNYPDYLFFIEENSMGFSKDNYKKHKYNFKAANKYYYSYFD